MPKPLLGNAHFRPNPPTPLAGTQLLVRHHSAPPRHGHHLAPPARRPGSCQSRLQPWCCLGFCKLAAEARTWRRSRWRRRRRRPWRRPTLHPRCRRRRGAVARPRAETSTGCVPSWPEVGVCRRDPGDGLEKSGHRRVRAGGRGDSSGLPLQRATGQ